MCNKLSQVSTVNFNELRVRHVLYCFCMERGDRSGQISDSHTKMQDFDLILSTFTHVNCSYPFKITEMNQLNVKT